MRDHAVISIPSSKPNVGLNDVRGNNHLSVLEECRSSTSQFAGKKKSTISFHILGQDLSYLPDGLKFIICSTGVFFFFLVYGYMQVRFYTITLLLYSILRVWREVPHRYIVLALFICQSTFSIGTHI